MRLSSRRGAPSPGANPTCSDLGARRGRLTDRPELGWGRLGGCRPLLSRQGRAAPASPYCQSEVGNTPAGFTMCSGRGGSHASELAACTSPRSPPGGALGQVLHPCRIAGRARPHRLQARTAQCPALCAHPAVLPGAKSKSNGGSGAALRGSTCADPPSWFVHMAPPSALALACTTVHMPCRCQHSGAMSRLKDAPPGIQSSGRHDDRSPAQT